MQSYRALQIASAGLAAIVLAGCQSTPAAQPAATATDAAAPRTVQAYKLGAGDQVRITVFNHVDLSGEFEVDGSGTIALPLIGQVQAIDLTTRELEVRLTERYSDGFLKEPRVNAEVMTYRPFYILGEVSTPGEYPYTSGLSVINAVAAAGGFSYRANKKIVYIKTAEGTQEVKYPLDAATMVQPGDTIRVDERIF
jgi:polysaccharide export outer membrane protein